MLPDFPALKSELSRRMMRRFQDLVDANAPLMARIRRHVQHEGDKFLYEDQNGRHVKKGFVKATAQIAVPANEPVDAALFTTERELERAAGEIAAQSEGLLFTAMHEATESVGNVLDAAGKPFDATMMWDMIERMQIEFDSLGHPEWPTIVLHPDTLASIRDTLADWESNPAFRRRRESIIARKREEWRDREINRKLVG